VDYHKTHASEEQAHRNGREVAASAEATEGNGHADEAEPAADQQPRARKPSSKKSKRAE
jgi:hypothetical protein